MNNSMLKCAAASLVIVCLSILSSRSLASPVLFGDYYRLGDDDPGALPGVLANSFTTDSGFYKRDLARSGLPTYSADTSPRAAYSKLSMNFSNAPLPPVSFVSPFQYYSRPTPLTTDQQGYGLETWVKPSNLTPLDPSGYALIAYNGEPGKNGFGFYQHGDQYVIRIGDVEKPLAPASTSEWTHLAYIHMFNTDAFYVLGKLIGEGDTGADSAATSGAFMLAANVLTPDPSDRFAGLIDETRFFSFNPLAAGAPGPADFLIVPEPAAALFLPALLLLLPRRRHR